jgi:hypothetical protein
MELLTRTFSAMEVTEITGVTKYNLQSYLIRGHLSFVGDDIEGGTVQGKRRSFYFFTVMQIALAKSLIDLGMTAKLAFHHVSEFALSGGDPFMGEPGRWAGLPYHHDHGETILAVSGARNCLGRWKDGEGDFFGETMSGLSESKSATDIEGAVFVNVSRVFRVVCERLGVDPHEVLDEAYADGFPDHGPEWPDAEG